MNVGSPPRILVIGTPTAVLGDVLAAAEVTHAANDSAAADLLRHGSFDGVIGNPDHVSEMIDRSRRDETILANVDQGIASLDTDGRVTWANAILREWCGSDPIGKTIIAAFSPCTVASEVANPLDLHDGHCKTFRVHLPPPSKHPYLDVRLRPVLAGDGTILHSVAIIQNVTGEVEQQKKLDALHQAGRDLANLEADQLAEMNLPTRIELLKQNLRGYVHNLLHYDTIEVRLLDRRGELQPLVEEGMTEEAAQRRLFSAETGNGVTGFVAFTGRSYLCPDTSMDTHYLEGAKGAKSSLTVPLKYNDEVIGTLNVESPRVNGFGTDDLQFVELLSKELAAALHTLDLLTAQQTCTLSQSIEAVNKEIALPVDEVLGSAALLYARLHNADSDAAKYLRRIMESARQVKECVNRVHRTMAPTECFHAPESLRDKRVLVVEQEERFRRQIHLLLGRMGVEVETVADPLEGLALCTGTTYDLIVLEIKPMGMRGFEAFCKFRLAEPNARVCLSTGFGWDSAHTVVLAKPNGLVDTLFKPFRIDQVTKAMAAPVPPPMQLPAAAC